MGLTSCCMVAVWQDGSQWQHEQELLQVQPHAHANAYDVARHLLQDQNPSAVASQASAAAQAAAGAAVAASKAAGDVPGPMYSSRPKPACPFIPDQLAG